MNDFKLLAYNAWTALCPGMVIFTGVPPRAWTSPRLRINKRVTAVSSLNLTLPPLPPLPPLSYLKNKDIMSAMQVRRRVSPRPLASLLTDYTTPVSQCRP